MSRNRTAEKPEEAKMAKEATSAEMARPAEEKAVMGGTFVYCGPSVRGVARQYMTYTGGTPKALSEFMKEHPIAEALTVPLAEFAAMRQKLETKGTAEAMLYMSLKAEL